MKNKAIVWILAIICIIAVLIGIQEFVFHKKVMTVTTGAAAEQQLKSTYGISLGSESIGDYSISFDNSAIANNKGDIRFYITNSGKSPIKALTSENFEFKNGNKVLSSNEASVTIKSDNGQFKVNKNYVLDVHLFLPSNDKLNNLTMTINTSSGSKTINL